ncbi:MAG TPA: MotA/TolQ/ExbB proton channel family protein [Bacteroidales bacterium]|nr:MotA/TolQ/ExbB proton channel family protein [Bacteroidales bacterium]
MSKTNNKGGQSIGDALKSWFTVAVIVISFVIAYLVYKYIMGAPINFEGGYDLIKNKVPTDKWHPIPGNYLAMIYKGGWIVPLLMCILLVLITFSIERGITLARAGGKGRINVFVKDLQDYLANDKIEEAIVACDKQKGSLANVMKAGLLRYRVLQKDITLSKDQKILALQKEFEEATALELPLLSRNLVILSTIASISVLIGLMGTVLGMIRAFAALAQAGAPDALALATGISEALINTAFGIGGSTLAIIMYNFYSTQIDSFTFKIDEAGFSLVQSFAAQAK